MTSPNFCVECGFPVNGGTLAVQVCAACAASSPDGKARAKLRRAMDSVDYAAHYNKLKRKGIRC